MAMTKKERAETEAAIRRAELLAALRWTTEVPPDVPPPPTSASGYTEGWEFNVYSGTVEQAWSGSVVHGSGPAPKEYDDRNRSASQRSVNLYSTKARALAALRHETERECAARLLKVDRLIKENA